MADPSAQEVLLMALINRARLDPAGEAARYGIDLNEGLAAGTISTVSKQPLAFSDPLQTAADGHSQAMIDADFFAHVNPITGSTPQTRATGAGYAGSVGENIAWRGSTGAIDATAMILQQHLDLFVDAGVVGRGHRLNILDGSYQQIGPGQVLGLFTQDGTTYNASMVTEDFGIPSVSGQFLTGIAYNDTNADAFYSVGEGRGGIAVAITAGAQTTGTAGAYSGAIGTGAQTVTFSGGDLAAAVSLTATITANRNALINLVGPTTIETSTSISETSNITKIVGLGNIGLTLTGAAGNDVIDGTSGNDTLNGSAGIDTAIFAGNRAAYTITGGGATRTVSGPDGTDTVSAIERLQFNDMTVTLDAPRGDFNGDGRSDILFRQIGSSFDSNYQWQMNDRSLSGQGAIDLFDKSFTVQVIGDFDGDSKADVLFQNPTTGGVWAWLLNGTSIASQGAVDVGDPAFHLLGTGDFNGDGKGDVLFRNDAGFVFEWQMNGLDNTPMAVSPLSAAWHVQGTGDFNGDGKDDILLRNIGGAANENGSYFLWQMNGNAIAGQGGIERPPTTWQTLGIGDFDGDGKDDFAVRNVSATSDNGAVWVYLMDGTAIKSQGAAGIAAAATWHLQQIADLNGDGKDDILYRNDAGYFYSWDMNGTAIASEGLLQGAAQWAPPSLAVVMPHWDLV